MLCSTAYCKRTTLTLMDDTVFRSTLPPLNVNIALFTVSVVTAPLSVNVYTKRCVYNKGISAKYKPARSLHVDKLVINKTFKGK